MVGGVFYRRALIRSVAALPAAAPTS